MGTKEKRYSIPCSYKGLISDFPFEKVPVLEVDGVQIPQSTTIARFLAKKAGMISRETSIRAVI